MRRHICASAVYSPRRILQIQLRCIRKQLHVSFPIALHRAYVFPISSERICKQPFSAGEHGRDNIFPEIICRIYVIAVFYKIFAQLFPRKDVYAHRRHIVLRLSRLFFKFKYSQLLVGVHYAESGSFFKRNFNYCYCSIRFFFDMRQKHFAVIHFIDMVSGEHHNVIRIISVYKIAILKHCVRCAGIPLSRFTSNIRREYKSSA